MLKKLIAITRMRFRKTDFNSFLFFLIFAIVIWVFVQFSKQYNQVLEIPLEYVNIPPDKLLDKDIPQETQLKMNENGFLVGWFSLFPPTFTIDLSLARVEEGNLIYVFDENRDQILSQFNIDFSRNDFVRDGIVVPFEQKQEKKIAIVPRIKVDYAPGYSGIGDLQLENDSIQVSGPDNILDTLSKLFTHQVSLSKVKKDISGSVLIDTTGLPNITLYKEDVNYTLQVTKFTEGNVQVPIELTNVPDGMNVVIFPKETRLFFQVNLSDFNKVTASDFRVVANFKNIRENQDFLIPEVIQKPEFTTNIRINEKKIQFIIKK